MARRIKSNPLSRFLAPPVMAGLYDEAAAQWQAGIDGLGFGRAYRDLAIRALMYHPAGRRERILDAGTGTGAAAVAVVQVSTDKNAVYDLLDPSAEMLAQAQMNLPAKSKLVQGVLGENAIPANTYDRVICAHVIEHCRDPQVQIEWLLTRLRPGGSAIFAISKPHWCTSLVRWRWGNTAISTTKVHSMLERAGFSDILTCRHASGPPSRVSCGYLARRPQ